MRSGSLEGKHAWKLGFNSLLDGFSGRWGILRLFPGGLILAFVVMVEVEVTKSLIILFDVPEQS